MISNYHHIKAVWSALTIILLITVGCAGNHQSAGTNESLRGNLFGTTKAVRSAQNDRQSQTVIPPGGIVSRKGVNERSLFAAALVAPVDHLAYDGRILPLVRPSGGYLAVQQNGVTPWETILARPDAPPPVYTTISIYAIELNHDTNRVQLIRKNQLEDEGYLGRNADDSGFLIEAPQTDGTRWIGKVDWESGQVLWILKGGTDQTVNAYAALNQQDGRLAWCARTGRQGEPDQFDLYAQTGDGNIATMSDDNAEWLFPTWANDGRTLFAYRLDEDGGLKLASFDMTTQGTARRPYALRDIVTNATRFVAYQCQAPLQQAAAPDATPRLLFYHPGYDRIALFDPRQPNFRLFAKLTVTAAWNDALSVIVGSEKALLLESAINPEVRSAQLAKRGYVIRSTNTPTQPFLLFTPSVKRTNDLECWVMQVFTDPQKAADAAIPLRNQ